MSCRMRLLWTRLVAISPRFTHIFVSTTCLLAAHPRSRLKTWVDSCGRSIEHQVSGVASAGDYGFIIINHYATDMRVYNSVVGETRVTIKDMDDFQVNLSPMPTKSLPRCGNLIKTFRRRLIASQP